MADFKNNLNIICLETEAFYALVDEVLERVSAPEPPPPDKWITDEEAMRLMHIRSKNTLQKLRDERAIRFTQPAKKLILYDRDSILEYLDKYAKDTI